MKERLLLLSGVMFLVFVLDGGRAAAEGPLPVSSDVPVTSVQRAYLPLVFQAGPPPSAMEAIDAALEAGQLTPPVALLYRVYAVYDDTRLPGQYRGPVTEADGERTMLELTRDFATLPGDVQRQVFPFLLPPGYAGSWYDLRQSGIAASAVPAAPPPFRADWQSITTTNGKAKVWWHKLRPQDAAAAQLAADMLNNHVWPKLTGLLREPKSDAGGVEYRVDGQAIISGDSGDGKFDVYIVDCQGAGCVHAQNVGYGDCKAVPTFVWINANYIVSRTGVVDTKRLEATVAHEFMHSVMKGYNFKADCGAYTQMGEAWANWAIDDAFPANQTENDYWDRFRAPDYPLFAFTGYEDWVFPYYLTKTHGREVLRDITAATEQHAPLAAVNQGLAVHGGLADVWHEYAVKLWNRSPHDLYQQENQQGLGVYGNPLFIYGRGATRADILHEVELNGAQWVEYVLPARLTGVSNRYFRFAFPDADVRSLGVFNAFPDLPFPPHDDLKVQALAKIAGRSDWEPVADWTQKREKQFCLQLPEEDLEELVLIFSNGQWENPDQEVDAPADWPFKVVASNIACKGWMGSITTHFRDGTRYEVTTATNLRFERRMPDEDDASDGQFYDVQQGNLHWELSGTSGGCQLRGSGDATVKPDDGDVRLNNTTRNTQYIGYGGPIGQTVTASTAYRDCYGGAPTPYTAYWGWWAGHAMPQQAPVVSADGLRIVGQNSQEQGDQSYIWEYNLTAIQ